VLCGRDCPPSLLSSILGHCGGCGGILEGMGRDDERAPAHAGALRSKRVGACPDGAHRRANPRTTHSDRRPALNAAPRPWVDPAACVDGVSADPWPSVRGPTTCAFVRTWSSPFVRRRPGGHCQRTPSPRAWRVPRLILVDPLGCGSGPGQVTSAPRHLERTRASAAAVVEGVARARGLQN
jgi:hypothetical protein